MQLARKTAITGAMIFAATTIALIAILVFLR